LNTDLDTIDACFSATGTSVAMNIDAAVIDNSVIGGTTAAAGTFTTLTASGVFTGASLDISGDIDIDGTANLDVVDIDGALTQDGGAVFNEASADVDFRVESNGNANMLFVDGGNDAVGIGTGTPAQLLEVKETSTTAGVHFPITLGGANHVTGYAVGLGLDPEGAGNLNKIAIVAEGTSQGYSKGKLHFLLNSADDSTQATLADSRMVIQDNGSVGIGTASPAVTLDVNGAITASSHITIPAASRLYLDGGGNTFIEETSADTMTFTTNNSERMRVTSTGQLLVGISSAYDSDFKIGGTALVGSSLIGTQNSTTGATHYAAIFRSNGNSTIGSILTSNTGTSYNTGSDYRLKDVKGSIQNGLERTLALNPVEFTWKSDGKTSEGFIAHEVQEAGWSDGISGHKDSEKTQEMDYGRITPLLVKAIQELSAEVEQLKQQAHDKCDN